MSEPKESSEQDLREFEESRKDKSKTKKVFGGRLTSKDEDDDIIRK